MPTILDRSRVYGTVIPPMDGKIFFEQDGKFYGNDFRRIYRDGEAPEDEAKLDRMAKARAAKANKTKQKMLTPDDPAAVIYDKPPWRRHTQHATITEKTGDKRKRKYPRSAQTVGKRAPQALPKAATVPAAPAVNLTAWAIGEEKILFGTVRQEIRQRFNVVVSNEPDALAVLVRENVVRAEDIPGYGEGEPSEAAA